MTQRSTNSVTVYAQSKILGRIVAPPQVGPGECTEDSNGQTVCFHPDAVYLNGSGQELMVADGTGEWWVKHAWVLGGEGYDNCELRPQESYDDCGYAEGVLLDDGLTMQVGIIDADTGAWMGNHRTPVFNEDEVTYRVTRLSPTNLDPDAGEIDLTLKTDFVLDWACEEEPSAFDNLVRECPKPQVTEFPLTDNQLPVMTTADGVEYVRTPDEFFADLPDWPYEAKYVEIDGLRQAYVDEGPRDGEIILLLHGQPAWSYLCVFR